MLDVQCLPYMGFTKLDHNIMQIKTETMQYVWER